MNRNLNDESVIIPEKNQDPKAISTLVSAFWNYPLFVEMIPEEETRKEKLEVIFRMSIKYGHKYGSIYITSENSEGVMIIINSLIHGKDSVLKWLLAGIIKVRLKLKKDTFNKWMYIDTFSSKLRKKYAPNDHIYLFMLGVDSSFQKQGFSRKLLNVAIKLSEEHSVPIYLETFKPENEKLYQHFGFSTNEKYPIPNTNLFLFSMLRKS